jgi:hypothetical protein
MASEKPQRKGARAPAPRPDPNLTSRPSSLERGLDFIDRRATLLAVALVLLATIRIVATYSVFSHTNDEPAHIGCGMEWLDKHVYHYEVQHPPLARVAVALGPYLLGGHSVGKTGILGMYLEGLEILYQGNHYDETVAAARIGILPFFWLGAFVVYAWAKKDFGAPTAVIALFLYTFLPPILAHAGLATTDMPLTACVGAAFFSGRLWLERPTLRSGAVFGVCGALALLSKFSSIPYFAAASALAIVAYAAAGEFRSVNVGRAIRDRLPSLTVTVSLVCVLIAAMYRFRVGEFFAGIQAVIEHNREGHPSYLLGHVSPSGFAGFYFVVLAFKTPIALLALTGIGIWMVKSRWRSQPAWLIPAAYSTAILAVASFSHINIGVRHILPIYTGFVILAAGTVVWLAQNASRIKWATAAIGILLAWYAGASILSHPDYLPYFNEFAGSHPEKILVDSDLDWGQDVKRLAKYLNAHGAKVLTMSSIYMIYPGGDMPVIRPSHPDWPNTGWNAVSLGAWKQLRFGLQARDPDKTFWPDRMPPQEVIGKSIYLWYFPPSAGYPL